MHKFKIELRDLILVAAFACCLISIMISNINNYTSKLQYKELKSEIDSMKIKNKILKELIPDSLTINININKDGKRIN